MDWLLDLLGLNKGKATINAAEQNKQLLSSLGTQIGNQIDTGTAQQAGYLNQSNDLASLGPNAAGIYGDALGLGGAEGSARAREAFQTGPGYEFQRDQGEQAVMRNRSALGGLQSGNTEMDLMRYGTGLADQSYQQWLGNLNTGINRQIGTLGDLGTLYGQDSAQKVGLYGDIGSGTMAANNQVAAGKEAGQGGLWDLFGNVAGIAGSFAGMGGGGAGGGGGSFGYGRGF